VKNMPQSRRILNIVRDKSCQYREIRQRPNELRRTIKSRAQRVSQSRLVHSAITSPIQATLAARSSAVI
jgi:hypothetical protein